MTIVSLAIAVFIIFLPHLRFIVFTSGIVSWQSDGFPAGLVRNSFSLTLLLPKCPASIIRLVYDATVFLNSQIWFGPSWQVDPLSPLCARQWLVSRALWIFSCRVTVKVIRKQSNCFDSFQQTSLHSFAIVLSSPLASKASYYLPSKLNHRYNKLGSTYVLVRVYPQIEGTNAVERLPCAKRFWGPAWIVPLL